MVHRNRLSSDTHGVGIGDYRHIVERVGCVGEYICCADCLGAHTAIAGITLLLRTRFRCDPTSPKIYVRNDDYKAVYSDQHLIWRSDANVWYLLATGEFCASRAVCSLLPVLLNFCNREFMLSDWSFVTRALITWFVCIIAPPFSCAWYYQIVCNRIGSESILRSRCGTILGTLLMSCLDIIWFVKSFLQECIHEYIRIISNFLRCVFFWISWVRSVKKNIVYTV